MLAACHCFGLRALFFLLYNSSLDCVFVGLNALTSPVTFLAAVFCSSPVGDKFISADYASFLYLHIGLLVVEPDVTDFTAQLLIIGPVWRRDEFRCVKMGNRIFESIYAVVKCKLNSVLGAVCYLALERLTELPLGCAYICYRLVPLQASISYCMPSGTPGTLRGLRLRRFSRPVPFPPQSEGVHGRS